MTTPENTRLAQPADVQTAAQTDVQTNAQTAVAPAIRPAVRRSRWLRHGLLTLAGSLFTASALLTALQPEASALPRPSLTAVRLTPPAAQENPATQEQALYIDETRVRPGDTLAAVLQRLDVEEKGLLAFLTHDPSARTIYKLYPGRAVQAARDGNGRLVWLRYHHTPAERQTDGQMMARWLEVSSSAAGFKAAEDSRAMGTHTRLAEGVIQSSLFGATDAAGIPDNITLQMARILGSHVDFARDLRKGDNFRVVYETYTHDGQAVSSGRVLALEFVNAGRLHSAVWFDPPDGSTSGYFDYQGQSLRGMFLRSALEFSRISSTFGMRTHPIHGGWRGHNGVDFAAPAGTPIHATADGEVTFIGQQNGFGNVIHLKHNNRYSTVYAHQSRFAAGLKQGSRVQQDQIIGYVGATGWATGPHLHYEMRLNNAPVNPLSIDVPKSVALEGKPLQAFQAALGNYQQHLQMLARMQDERTAVAQR